MPKRQYGLMDCFTVGAGDGKYLFFHASNWTIYSNVYQRWQPCTMDGGNAYHWNNAVHCTVFFSPALHCPILFLYYTLIFYTLLHCVARYERPRRERLIWQISAAISSDPFVPDSQPGTEMFLQMLITCSPICLT